MPKCPLQPDYWYTHLLEVFSRDATVEPIIIYIWPLLSGKSRHTSSGHGLLWKIGSTEIHMATAFQHTTVWGDQSSIPLLKLMNSVRPLLPRKAFPSLGSALRCDCDAEEELLTVAAGRNVQIASLPKNPNYHLAQRRLQFQTIGH